MDESLFKELVERWVSTTNATLEDKSEEANYRFNRLLRLNLSTDHKFSAVSGTNNRVKADIVSMDSDLPLKSRGSLETYNGKIPKIGLQKYLKESDLTAIDTLIARNAAESTIAAKVFDDYTGCVVGAREQVEYMTHQMESNGLVEVPSEDNTGRSIRVDYGVPDSNRFGVAALWSDPAADIAGDLERIYNAAIDNGDNIVLAKMNRVTYNQVRKNASVKALYNGFREVPTGTEVTLNEDKLNELFESEFGFRIEVINRSFEVEKNGVVKSVKAWADGAVSFWTTDGLIGDLVYADLAEKTRPVKAKVYSQPAEWLLAAKWSEGNPLREFTEASGFVMPVLNNVDHVYFLDTATVAV